ncbi:hypothetical protein [Homoserinibacter sp. GY 40078]|uniref:hypothetical protein n=1 Tax=Homoserinibacter sp. GY 40078 TaxID=2603275 RepID=UPI0011C82FD2|nr:hypothetical protein [Homoserinibacter sp. GY 40078]TXK17169.1 hypothetical protein FVQ89_09910 [Homoserinibacter sp. GY 40078]
MISRIYTAPVAISVALLSLVIAVVLSPLWFVVVAALACVNIVRNGRRLMADPSAPLATVSLIVVVNLALIAVVLVWLASLL